MRHRLRIRFRKEEDLRFISHRDLARLWERMFRRAGVHLAMSEGFHPKVKLSFPSALSLGVAGLDEVVEAELDEEIADEEVLARLREQAPAGMTVDRLERVPPGAKKAQVTRVTYEVPLPADRWTEIQQAIAVVLERPEVWVERSDRAVQVDVRATLEHLALDHGRLVITLRAGREAAARPRDVLQLLGLGAIEHSGVYLTRTRVELA